MTVLISEDQCKTKLFTSASCGNEFPSALENPTIYSFGYNEPEYFSKNWLISILCPQTSNSYFRAFRYNSHCTIFRLLSDLPYEDLKFIPQRSVPAEAHRPRNSITSLLVIWISCRLMPSPVKKSHLRSQRPTCLPLHSLPMHSSVRSVLPKLPLATSVSDLTALQSLSIPRSPIVVPRGPVKMLRSPQSAFLESPVSVRIWESHYFSWKV